MAGALAYDLAFPTLQAWGLFGVAQSITLPLFWNVPYAALAVTFGAFSF